MDSIKISDMQSKTSEEVSPDDFLIIEDKEDTKSIKVSEFMKYVNKASKRHTKVYMNELFDQMIQKLSETKFVVAQVSHYLMQVWISEPGVANIALCDTSDSHWLTATEIGKVLVSGTPIITMTVGINTIRCNSYTVKKYPTDGTEENEVLAEALAGYIRASFDNVGQNETATVTYKDISMEMRDEEGHPIDLYDPAVKTFIFESSPELFINTVPFESAI